MEAAEGTAAAAAGANGGGSNGGQELEVCALCTSSANLRCTGCLTTFYCSKEHQKQHWRQHKQACSAYKICQSQEYGRHIVATRDLRPGEVILQESPLVLAPSSLSRKLCLGCHEEASLKHRCSQCAWPLCSQQCEASPHHKPECHMLRRGRKREGATSVTDLLLQGENMDILLQVVAILRCVHLKFASPARYQTCLGLQSVPRGASGSAVTTDSMVVKSLLELFDLGQGDGDAAAVEQELLHVSGIFAINSHELPLKAVPLQAVYKDASMLRHSCLNNASKHFDQSGRIVIRAAVQIRKGQSVAINYSDPMWGTASRQAHLLQTKFFTCLCPRCKDPQELDTNFSSVICKNCSSPQGYLSPRDPTDRRGGSRWRCGACGGDEPAEYVNAVIKSIGEELLKLDRSSVQACLKFLKRHSQNLHQNHFFLMDVRLALAQMIGKSKDGSRQEESEKELILKQKLCVELMDVVNVISPGISRLRAVVLYELQSALSQYARRKYLNGEITQTHLKNIYKEVRNNLSECIQIFGYEPACLPEGQLAAIARLDLLEVDVFVEQLKDDQAAHK